MRGERRTDLILYGLEQAQKGLNGKEEHRRIANRRRSIIATDQPINRVHKHQAVAIWAAPAPVMSNFAAQYPNVPEFSYAACDLDAPHSLDLSFTETFTSLFQLGSHQCLSERLAQGVNPNPLTPWAFSPFSAHRRRPLVLLLPSHVFNRATLLSLDCPYSYLYNTHYELPDPSG